MLLVDTDRPTVDDEDRVTPDPVVRTAAPTPDRERGRRGGWEPLAGRALLERLRVTGRPRPPADPELARRLRAAIEGGAGIADHASAADSPLVVTKSRLSRVLACEAHHLVTESHDRAPTAALACGALIDVLFRQLVTVGAFGDPFEDGLAGLGVDDRQQELLAWIDRMPAADRVELRAEVERQAGDLLRRWPKLDARWLPRTQEPIRAGLAGGAVELSGRVDLAIGPVAEEWASVALVEVTSGVRRPEHRSDRHFYALIETLRSPAPPFLVATYYTRTGELDTDPVTEELLAVAAARTAVGVRSLWQLAHGATPERSSGDQCGRCDALATCAPDLGFFAELEGTDAGGFVR
jgi:hypothetical protein